jgi:H+-transporting ATPase
VKLFAYRILDPAGAVPKTLAKTKLVHEDTAKTPSDLTPQIAKRAYELYQERSRKNAPAIQDWERAEREIREHEAHK